VMGIVDVEVSPELHCSKVCKLISFNILPGVHCGYRRFHDKAGYDWEWLS
jgi:hypothetical protein